MNCCIRIMWNGRVTRQNFTNSPPYFPPLCLRKEGESFGIQKLTPSLRSREGVGGEYMFKSTFEPF